MPDVQRNEVVPYTAEQMYDLVNDVEKYSQYVPGCTQSIVHSQSEDEMKATIVISASGFSKQFTTLNRLQKNKMIEIRLLDGPFKQLEGFWRFESADQPGHCNVLFDLQFELSGSFLDRMISPFFSQIANALVDSFNKRAAEIYGPHTS